MSRLSSARLRYIADNQYACATAAHWESVAMAAELLRLRRRLKKNAKQRKSAARPAK